MANGDAQNGDSGCDEFELMTIDKIINGKVRKIVQRTKYSCLILFPLFQIMIRNVRQ